MYLCVFSVCVSGCVYVLWLVHRVYLHRIAEGQANICSVVAG